MRGSVKKSALILGVLLLSIAAAGQVFPGRDSQDWKKSRMKPAKRSILDW